MNGAPSTVIIKPDNEHLPGIVENEAYCLTLAGAIGIDAVEVGILEAGDRTALVVTRYDRKLRKDGSPRRLHQEDFAQANGVYPGQKYERGTARGPSLASILRTSRYLPPSEGLKLLDQVIFNILVANTDAHAKNYSLMLSNNRSLAPLYDVSTALPWPHVNQYFAQDIVGRKRKPGDVDKRHWDAIADEAGFNARGVRLRVQELVDSMIGSRIAATERVASMPGTVREAVEQVAELTENSALRIAGRLRS
jgi:serine/threonine-protein kinase HipA